MLGTLLVIVVLVVIAVAFARSRSGQPGGGGRNAAATPTTAPPPASSSRAVVQEDEEEVTEETLAVTGGKPFLKAISGPGRMETFSLSPTGTTSIGRSSENSIVLAEDAASSRHCQIEKLGNSYLLSDLGSTNKTWVNGKEQARVELKNGDQIKVGDTTFVFGLFGDRK